MEWTFTTMGARETTLTGALKWQDGVLMQEWSIKVRYDGQWHVRYEWRPVPTVDTPARPPVDSTWVCPIGHEGCTRNCGSYGCGN